MTTHVISHRRRESVSPVVTPRRLRVHGLSAPALRRRALVVRAVLTVGLVCRVVHVVDQRQPEFRRNAGELSPPRSAS